MAGTGGAEFYLNYVGCKDDEREHRFEDRKRFI